MRQTDIISASLIIIVGLATIIFVIPAGVYIEIDGEYGLRPDFFPFLSMGVVVVMSASFLAHRLIKTSEDGAPPPIQLRGWLFLLTAAVLLVGGFFLFKFFGFLAGAPAVIIAFMLIMGERRIIPILSVTIAGPLVVWLFFWKLLNFPLP